MKEILLNERDSRVAIQTAIEALRNNRQIIREVLPVHLIFNSGGKSITLPELLEHVANSSTRDISQELKIADTTVNHNRIVALEFLRKRLCFPIPNLYLTDNDKKKIEVVGSDYANYEIYEQMIKSKRFHKEEETLRRLYIDNRQNLPLIEFLQMRNGWRGPRIQVEQLMKYTGKNQAQIAAYSEAGKLFLNELFETNLSHEETVLRPTVFKNLLISYDEIVSRSTSMATGIELLQAIYLIPFYWPERNFDIRVMEYMTGVRQLDGVMNKEPTFTKIATHMGIHYSLVQYSIARVRTILRREMYKMEEEKSEV